MYGTAPLSDLKNPTGSKCTVLSYAAMVNYLMSIIWKPFVREINVLLMLALSAPDVWLDKCGRVAQVTCKTLKPNPKKTRDPEVQRRTESR